MKTVFQELKRRRVLQTAAVYIAVVWAATEMLGFLLPALNFPRWTVTVVAILFVLGFPVAMFLAWVFDVKADGIQQTAPNSAKGKLTISIAIAFLLAGTAGLFFLIYPQGPETSTPSITAFDPPDNSIAVLPFANMSDDPSNQYLSDGIAEELLNTLARNQGLMVTARTSSFLFRDNELDVRLIGERLNVAKVLDGSVKKEGKRIRVTVQLINTKDGYHDWLKTYDRELNDIFKIQDDIAQSVGEELFVRMAVVSRGIGTFLSSPRVENLDAYDYYLRGRHALYGDEQPDVAASIGLLRSAVDAEPGFADAWLELAVASSVSAEESQESDESVIEAARKALALDPSLGEAHALIAGVQARRWRWLEAEHEYRSALALEPQNTSILRSYGMFQARSGHIEKSHDQLAAAFDRDPLSPKARQNDRTTVEVLLRQRKYDDAREFLRRERQNHGSWFWPELVLDALQDKGLVASASAELEVMVKDSQLTPARAFIYQSWLGQWDAAHQNAIKSTNNKTIPLEELWSSELSVYRTDPRFAELVSQTGLIEYWEAHGYPDTCAQVKEIICRD